MEKIIFVKCLNGKCQLQELIESFEGNLPNEAPLWNLRPIMSTLVFQTDNHTWNPQAFFEALPESEVCWHAESIEKKTAIAVFAKQYELRWGR